MRDEKKNKIKWVHLRLTPEEHLWLQEKIERTTCRNRSEYIRDVLFNRPLVTTYRNTSLDSCMEQLALLNRELNAIGNNINQITKKMHQAAPDAITSFLPEYLFQSGKIERQQKEIKALLLRLSESWLRS